MKDRCGLAKSSTSNRRADRDCNWRPCVELSKSQTPRSKSQGNIKLQNSKRTAPAQSHFLVIEVQWCLSLVIGAWDLFGTWVLGIGIYRRRSISTRVA